MHACPAACQRAALCLPQSTPFPKRPRLPCTTPPCRAAGACVSLVVLDAQGAVLASRQVHTGGAAPPVDGPVDGPLPDGDVKLMVSMGRNATCNKYDESIADFKEDASARWGEPGRVGDGGGSTPCWGGAVGPRRQIRRCPLLAGLRMPRAPAGSCGTLFSAFPTGGAGNMVPPASLTLELLTLICGNNTAAATDKIKESVAAGGDAARAVAAVLLLPEYV